MKVIYLVWGSAGCYDDFREWTVAAYEQEADADAHVDAAQKWNDENWHKSNYFDLKNPYDPDTYPASDNQYCVVGIEITDKFVPVVQQDTTQASEA